MQRAKTGRRRGGTWVLTSALALGLSIPALGQQGGGAAATPRGPAVKGARPKAGGVPPKAADNPEAVRAMEALLQEWAERSADLKSLDAQFLETDVDPVWNRTRTFEGRALLQEPSRACLEFKEIKEKGKPPVFDNRIVCNGQEVYQFQQATRQINVYPLSKQQQRRALDEGPLPFLFNVQVAAIKKRYAMDLLKSTPTQHFIRIIPKEAVDQQEFSMAMLALNRKTFLPDAIRLYAPAGGKPGQAPGTKTFELKAIVPNAEIPAANFDGQAMVQALVKAHPANAPQAWKVIYNPADDEAPAAAPNRTTPVNGRATPRPTPRTGGTMPPKRR